MAFDAGTILAKMALDISQWEKSARAINESQKKMAGQTKKTGSAFKGMWKQVAVGMGVTTLISQGIREIGRQIGDVIRKGREFEKEWANVTTMLSVSKKETLKMKNELMKLSPTLGDTTDLARGMYQVLSASIEPAKAIKFLGEAAISAKAGVTDTKTAVDALTTVINAYGLEAENVTEISDIMFQTVKRGKTTYAELAQSLGTVVPVAATVGVNFKEVAAAVATLTRQGIVASKATMQLRQVMMAVLKPSEQATEVAKDLGIQLGSMALRTKGLSGFLFELKEKTKGNADQMAKIVPNVRALTAVMALAGEQADDFAYDLGLMEKALGSTDEAFSKQMESVDFWLEAFSVAGDKFKLSFFEGLVEPIKEGITSAKELDAQTRDMQSMFGDLGKVIGTLGKTQVDELTAKWKHNKLALQSLRFVYLAMASFITKGQVPTLKNAAKAWGEHYRKLVENERQLKIMEDPYFGWAGMVAKSIDLLREKVRWILEDSKSSEESIRRLEELKIKLQEASEGYSGLTDEIKKSAKKIASLVKEMTDEIYEATHNEFEVRVRMARETYEERKALLEAEKADKQAFVLLEKAYATELDGIETDRTQKLIEAWKEKGKAVTAGLLAWYNAEKATREKIQGLHATYTDITRQITLSEKDYKLLTLDEWYAGELEKLGTNLEAKLALEKAYALQKEEIDKEYALTSTDIAMAASSILTDLAGKSKGLAIAGAVISTYAAAAKTLQTFGMPLAIPYIAMAIAAGFKQVTAIKAQEIPSAEAGAYLPNPAIIEAGHGPRGEVILPLDRAPMGGLQKIIIQNRITIGEQTFYKESVKNINKAGAVGDLIVPNKVVV